MDAEIAGLPLRRMAELLCLCYAALIGDDHVAQGEKPCLRVCLQRILLGKRPGDELEHGKGQHIGGTIHPALLQVDLMDALIVCDEHVHLTGDVDPLLLKRRGDTPPEQRLIGELPFDLTFQNDLVIHGDFAPSLLPVVPGAARPAHRR